MNDRHGKKISVPENNKKQQNKNCPRIQYADASLLKYQMTFQTLHEKNKKIKAKMQHNVVPHGKPPNRPSQATATKKNKRADSN